MVVRPSNLTTLNVIVVVAARIVGVFRESFSYNAVGVYVEARDAYSKANT